MKKINDEIFIRLTKAYNQECWIRIDSILALEVDGSHTRVTIAWTGRDDTIHVKEQPKEIFELILTTLGNMKS